MLGVRPFFLSLSDFMFILLQYMFIQLLVPFQICYIFYKYDTHRRNFGVVRGQMSVQHFCYQRIVFFFGYLVEEGQIKIEIFLKDYLGGVKKNRDV